MSYPSHEATDCSGSVLAPNLRLETPPTLCHFIDCCADLSQFVVTYREVRHEVCVESRQSPGDLRYSSIESDACRKYAGSTKECSPNKRDKQNAPNVLHRL